MDPLQPLREKLDSIDRELVTKIAQRLSICNEIAHVKHQHGIPMMQPHRVDYVYKRCSELGQSHGVSGDFIVEIYRLIISETCRLEDEIISSISDSSSIGSP